MTFRKISIALLLITLSVTSAFALGFGKKKPSPSTRRPTNSHRSRRRWWKGPSAGKRC